jgi:hypothetical protein
MHCGLAKGNAGHSQTAAQLEQAANGVEIVELGIAIRLALTLEGLEYWAQ